ncbi:MAG: hypothetical protein QXZ24_02495, partial [Candidatus Jordarchaeales archaeon]
MKPALNHSEENVKEERTDETFWSSLMPAVRTNRGMIEPFDVRKIIDSLVKEAGVSREVASEVAKNVVKR